MPMQIADPRADLNDRYAGVSSVKNNGTVGLRKEAGVLMAGAYPDNPTYVLPFNVAATVAMDIVSLAPSLSKLVRLKRIVIVNPGSATAAALVDLALGVATAFGSGGAAPNPAALDGANAPRVGGVTGGPDTQNATGTYHTGDTTQATGFITGYYSPLVTLSVPAAAAAFTPLTVYDARDPLAKPLTVSTPSGGVIVLRTPAVGAGATGLRGYVEFTLDDA